MNVRCDWHFILLLAERRTTCLDEVQKLKTCDTKDDACMNEQPEGFPCNATLTISGTQKIYVINSKIKDLLKKTNINSKFFCYHCRH